MCTTRAMALNSASPTRTLRRAGPRYRAHHQSAVEGPSAARYWFIQHPASMPTSSPALRRLRIWQPPLNFSRSAVLALRCCRHDRDDLAAGNKSDANNERRLQKRIQDIVEGRLCKEVRMTLKSSERTNDLIQKSFSSLTLAEDQRTFPAEPIMRTLQRLASRFLPRGADRIHMLVPRNSPRGAPFRQSPETGDSSNPTQRCPNHPGPTNDRSHLRAGHCLAECPLFVLGGINFRPQVLQPAR